MLFQYIGDGEDSPLECDVYDHHFVLNGEPVEVKNDHAAHKLMGNKTFKFEPSLVAPKAPVFVPEPDDKSFDVVIEAVDPEPEVVNFEQPIAKKKGRWSK